MKRFFVLLGAMGIAAVTSFAAPLDNKDVAAEPALLAHVDADALRSTAVGKAVLADADVQTKLAAVQAMFNFDFRTQLHGFTIYTTVDHTEDPVLIIYAEFDPERLITLAKVFPGFQAETNGARVIYNWVDQKKKSADGSGEIYASLSGHRVIFSKSKSQITTALDVIEGKTASFSDGKLLLETEPGELVVAQGVALKLNFANNNPSAAIFQASKSVRVQLGEEGDDVSAKVRLDAKDDDAANQIAAMVNGLLAVLHFQKDNPDLLKLANAINVRQDGEAVTLGAKAPSADIIHLLQKGAAEERQKQEQHLNETNAPAGNGL